MERQKSIKAFEKHKPMTPMTGDEMRILFNLLMSNNETLSVELNQIDKSSEEYLTFEPIINSPEAKLFRQSIEEWAGIKTNLGILLMMMLYIEGSHRAARIYALYISSKLPRNSFLDLNLLCKDLFPWGFFSKEQVGSIWDEIKENVAIKLVA